MRKLFLDIETLPASQEEGVTETLKYLYERKMEKLSKKYGEDEPRQTFEEFVDATSFDGAFGRVLCIALAVNDDEVKCYCSDESGKWDEKKVLENFWKVAGQCDLFVGHNILDFDLRFLWQRSIILGVKPSWQESDSRAPKYFSFARYRSSPIFDTMHEWAKWGRDNAGLEHVALALGIPTPKTGIDGSEVARFYTEGKILDICEYCKRDVDTTRAVYKRMIFT